MMRNVRASNQGASRAFRLTTKRANRRVVTAQFLRGKDQSLPRGRSSSGRVAHIRNTTHKDQEQPHFLPPRQIQLPHHRQRQEKQQGIRGDIHGAVGIVSAVESDAMARFVGPPVLGDGGAAEEQSEEIGEEIAGHEGHDDPGGPAERFADAKEPEVHEQEGESVAVDADEVEDGGDVHPLWWSSSVRVARRVVGNEGSYFRVVRQQLRCHLSRATESATPHGDIYISMNSLHVVWESWCYTVYFISLVRQATWLQNSN